MQGCGRIEVEFHNQAVNFDSSAQLHAPTIPQSTSNRVSVVGTDRGVAWRFHFYEREIGVFGRFWGGGRIVVAFCNQAVDFNGSAWLHTSKTPRSTSNHAGVKAPGTLDKLHHTLLFYSGITTI